MRRREKKGGSKGRIREKYEENDETTGKKYTLESAGVKTATQMSESWSARHVKENTDKQSEEER